MVAVVDGKFQFEKKKNENWIEILYFFVLLFSTDSMCVAEAAALGDEAAVAVAVAMEADADIINWKLWFIQ